VGFSLELTIGDALDVMGHYEIFSVAVVNAKGHAIGQVDYLDLLCALVRLTAEADQVGEGARGGRLFLCVCLTRKRARLSLCRLRCGRRTTII
jgi:hypothetical protein